MIWIGNGVVSIKGKDYGNGDTLPENVDKESLKSWKERGLVEEPKKAVSEKQSESKGFKKPKREGKK